MPFTLATYRAEMTPRAGIISGDAVYDAASLTGREAYTTMQGILSDWQAAETLIRDAMRAPRAPFWPLAQTHLLAPLLAPGAIYCAGANYSDHAAEMARRMGREPDPDPKAKDAKPWHFLKSPASVTGPGATIAATHHSRQLDWEVELAAIIGRKAKNAGVEDALSYVAGYTAANDLSARDLSRRAGQAPDAPFRYDWIGQKCFDGACPMGPWIVPASDIPDPQALAMKLWVNDAPMQDSNTAKMIFTLAEQIAHLSAAITLNPGDVILTGTPAGVGAGRGVFLKAGDTVRIEIERIGTLSNIIA